MDNLDKKILSELQDNFPLNDRPYDIIAERLGIEIDELWPRVVRLIDSGVIRRMGASLDSGKLGYSSTLAAIRIRPDLVEQAADVIGKYSEVTHSYLRSNSFNIWFTLIAENETRIEEILEIIRAELSLNVSDVLNLPAKKVFKLDARFKIKDPQEY